MSTHRMVRPPPLHLRFDNRYSHPALRRTEPRCPTLTCTPTFSRIYTFSWRAPVILVSSLNVLRYLNSYVFIPNPQASMHAVDRISFILHLLVPAFNDFHVDKHLGFSELAILSYVTTIIYITLCTVELFGSVVNLLPRRLHLIETYTRLVDISAILVAVAGLTYSGTYLVYKDELISECVHSSIHDEGLLRSTFRLNPWPTSNDSGAVDCTSAYSADTLTHLLALPISFLLPMILQLIVAHTYYRQSTDPLHKSNLCHQYQHPNSHTATHPPRLPSSSSSNATQVGWLHFPSQSPFARLRAMLPWHRRTFFGYQRLSTEPHTQRQHDHISLHKLQSVPSLHPIKEAPEVPSPVSPEAGLTPGPPSFGGGHGYNLHNGHLSAFTIGSLDTGMEDDAF
ncbi:hypothetical protein PC9H_000169 [Pleurotus ostreatus]|uniref:Uncharacterized protein n=1 Tax=Pleurotus ostreatus TaxID=5322 RepID=A0A8H7A479_PLEOS|nr:uncharacterized protein PC9H_000169 [Pleurotus ostreatus]KAF7439832.1 hypothetical protein PC9H_000169 [Pleurotus ostreatus]